jgi:hypothetical protein
MCGLTGGWGPGRALAHARGWGVCDVCGLGQLGEARDAELASLVPRFVG